MHPVGTRPELAVQFPTGGENIVVSERNLLRFDVRAATNDAPTRAAMIGDSMRERS